MTCDFGGAKIFQKRISKKSYQDQSRQRLRGVSFQIIYLIRILTFDFCLFQTS